MVCVLCSPNVPILYQSLSLLFYVSLFLCAIQMFPHSPYLSLSLLFYVSLFLCAIQNSLTLPTSLSPVLSLSDIEIDVPDELDITLLRGCGLQPGEVELPEGDAPPSDQAPVAVEIDEGVVMQLMSMGFDMEGCRKAVFHTKNQGRWRQEPRYIHVSSSPSLSLARCGASHELGARAHGRSRLVYFLLQIL